MEKCKVSFIIIAYNAECYLNNLLENLKQQDYNPSLIEVILVDSNSNDSTKAIMKEFKEKNFIYSNVKVLNNDKRTLPCGWNIALENSVGDIILRVDAHTKIPENFISKNVECILNGEDICGGKVESILESDDNWSKTLLIAENSAFGGGVAAFRRVEEKKYVNTLAFAAYRKSVFDKVGRYNENLSRTEDNEMHYRMKTYGYKFALSPEIKSQRYSRNNLRSLIKQKYQNGYWIGLTLGVSPKCFEKYHFIPLIFVLSLIIGVGLLSFKISILLKIILSSYLIATIMMMLLTINKNKFKVEYLTLPIIYLLIHVSYGVGTLIGLIKMPCWRKNNIKR